MQSNQELFAKGLAAYEKVVGRNYMAHREVYRLLHELLVSEARIDLFTPILRVEPPRARRRL